MKTTTDLMNEIKFLVENEDFRSTVAIAAQKTGCCTLEQWNNDSNLRMSVWCAAALRSVIAYKSK